MTLRNYLKIKNLGLKIVITAFFTFAFFFSVFSFADAAQNPTILYTDILSGPNSGGENNNGTYLSIFGKGFGATQGTSKVYINNVEVADYKYWGPAQHGRPDIQQISVQPGPNVTSGPIKVVVNGKSSNTDHTFTVRPGNIYFVDNVVGNQNTGVVGDISKPFRYIIETMNRSDFGPGDIIVIRGGVWSTSDSRDYYSSDNYLYLTKSGTINDPIMMIGYPGESITLLAPDGSGITEYGDGMSVIRFNADNWVISNIYANSNNQWKNSIVYSYTRSNIRLVNIEAGNMHGKKIGTGNGTIGGSGWGHKILGSYIHNTGDTKWYHSIYFDSGSSGISGNYEIAFNHIKSHVGGRAIQINNSGGSSVMSGDVSIHDNLIHYIRQGNGGGGDAMIFWSKPEGLLEIYNNVIYDVDGGESTTSGVLMFNAGSADLRLYNNTIYASNLVSTQRIVSIANINSAEIKNNIFVSNDPNYWYVYNTSFVNNFDGNLFYGSSRPTPNDPNKVTSDPLFVNIAGRDFHLQSDSPAIDRGVNIPLITKDYDGNPRPIDGDANGIAATDIGAYEYTGSTPPPPIYQCSDNKDNDEDGLIDMADPGCTSQTDNDEYNVPQPPTCTSFTYSPWSQCQSDNTQTRTVTSSSPQGCTGGDPGPLTQPCVYTPPSSLTISNLNPSNYQTGNFTVGDQYYIDRTYTISGIPSSYQGLLWIKTGNNDKSNTSSSFLSFDTNQDVTVYVAYDSRASSLPNWLTSSYTDTGSSIIVQEGSFGSLALNIWQKSYSAGTIILGGNLASGAKGAGSMYTVLIKPSANTPPPPLLGDLNQDGIVNTLDWSIMNAQWNTNNPQSDLNKDGTVNTLDWSIMNENWSG